MPEIPRPLFGTVSSLFMNSLHILAYNLHLHISDVANLPPNIKTKLLYILSKRGLLNDGNVAQCLHRNVKDLDLSECDITDVALVKIAGVCKNLVKLDLNSAKSSRTEITDAGVIALAKQCKWIQVVYLRRCLKLTDAAIVEIAANCRYLKQLNLGGCQCITDRSLHSLAQHCAALESLNISSTKITDAGVYDLSSGNCGQTLKELHIAMCVNLSDEAVEAVIQFCPKIQILLFHGCPKITESSRVALEELYARNSTKMKQLTWTIY